MHKFFFILLSLLILLISTIQNCFALQTISIADNRTKEVTVSSYELSRIFIKDDRIQNVRGLEGAYILTKDANQRQVYIKPTSPSQAKPFNLFIATEKGHNFNLVIVAKNILGQDIEIKPTTPSKEAESWEKGSEYSQILVKLITSMINNELPAGYSVMYPSKKDKEIKHEKVTLKLQKSYMGKNLFGEEYLVKNRHNHTINLSENNFLCTEVQAITILNPDLPARGQTMLYRVVSHE